MIGEYVSAGEDTIESTYAPGAVHYDSMKMPHLRETAKVRLHVEHPDDERGDDEYTDEEIDQASKTDLIRWLRTQDQRTVRVGLAHEAGLRKVGALPWIREGDDAAEKAVSAACKKNPTFAKIVKQAQSADAPSFEYLPKLEEILKRCAEIERITTELARRARDDEQTRRLRSEQESDLRPLA